MRVSVHSFNYCDINFSSLYFNVFRYNCRLSLSARITVFCFVFVTKLLLLCRTLSIIAFALYLNCIQKKKEKQMVIEYELEGDHITLTYCLLSYNNSNCAPFALQPKANLYSPFSTWSYKMADLFLFKTTFKIPSFKSKITSKSSSGSFHLKSSNKRYLRSGRYL